MLQTLIIIIFVSLIQFLGSIWIKAEIERGVQTKWLGYSISLIRLTSMDMMDVL